MGVSAAFEAHLMTGLTTLARCWKVVRRDGTIFGFTDHDCGLSFDGTAFLADSGMTAFALQQGSGLGVDNTETLGALSADAISEEDIAAGLYDGAEVICWLVNWAEPTQRMVLFAGHIGEITRSSGQFQAELRGLSEPLNQPMGRAYQKTGGCSLGGADCGVDLDRAEFTADVSVLSETNGLLFEVKSAAEFDDGWFTHGLLIDDTAGQQATIKRDSSTAEGREIALWTPLPGVFPQGAGLRLVAGCDRQFATCRFKFSNHLNFRGFPDIPGDEWIATLPREDGRNDGGSLR